MKVEIEKMVEDLQNQVFVWKEKVESVLDGVVKN